MNNTLLEKMNSFFYNEITTKLSNVFIFKDDENSYLLYDRYYLTRTKSGINVTLKYGNKDKVFNTFHNAIAWCIFDKRNKIDIANRIEYLDQMIAGIDAATIMHKKIIDHKNDLDSKYVAIAKMSENKHKRKIFSTELSRYINDSKDWQMKQFSKN